MLTLDQLTRLREVCVNGCDLAKWIFPDTEVEKATAALADIDAEIQLLKGTSC